MAPGFESRTPDWIALDEAVRRVLGAVEPLTPTELALDEALGLVLAEPVLALVSLPPYDNAAMDGYAVRARDLAGASPTTPVTLHVSRAVHAGADPGPALAPSGEAVRIMTGAPVPPGTDTVVRVEDTDAEAGSPGEVRIRSDSDAGRNVRPGGEDFAAGAVMAPAGTRLTAGWTAMVAAAGAGHVAVHPAPRVAVLSCGDELRRAGEMADVLVGRAIPESNGPMIAASAREAGGEALPLGIARDEAADLRRHLARAHDADLLVTLGGASMGEADLMKRTLVDEGLELDFWRVRMRPGSPVSFGLLPRAGARPLPVLGLPGNPASAFVTFQLLGHPLVRRLAGDPRPHRAVVWARADEELRGASDLCHFVRVRLEGTADRPRVRTAGRQGSGLVSSLGPADGLAILPEGLAGVPAGERVQVLVLGSWPPPQAEAGYRTRVQSADEASP